MLSACARLRFLESFRVPLALASLSLLAACRAPSSGGDEKNLLLLFPPPPAKARVQFLTWASGSPQVEQAISSFDRFLLGEDAPRSRRLLKPYGLAVRDGVVYICDTKALNIARLDFKNHTYTVFGDRGVERLRKPVNLAIDELGYKFVVDAVRKQVVVFGGDDHYVTAFDIPAPCHPVDIAIWENELYVLDNDDTPGIVVMDRTTGEIKRTFGKQGKGPGEFHIPNSLAIDGEGYLYVSDTLNFRIQKLTREGKPVWQKGAPGRQLGFFGRPRGIRVGPDGIVYVVEGAMQLVQMFDQEGRVLMALGGPGNVPGGLVLPAQVALDESSIPYFQQYVHPDFEVRYLVFVTSQFGDHKLSVYALGSFPEGYRLSESEIATLPKLNEKTGIAPVEEPSPGPTPAPEEPREESGGGTR